MKRSNRCPIDIIRSGRGEMIIESIASLLVLAVLLLSAAAMVGTAMRITSVSAQKAKTAEQTLNPVVWFADEIKDQSQKVTVAFSAPGISSKHQGFLYTDGDVITFVPES
ncbi:MAG: hypothetical protein FWH14_02295 [Oscillospiraceae bacterium]|nr:hypothetical protein [Oscillospiraceae bacterium]